MSAIDDHDRNIGHALERLARSQPAAPALHVPGRKSLTYADLGAQISYVREALGNWGVAHGDVIAGVIPSRPEMALACATIPAAAIFTPLSPTETSDDYAELLTRLRPKLVIVPDAAGHPVREAARRCRVAEAALVTDRLAPAGMYTLALARDDDSLGSSARLGSDLAFVVSTSGTTGRRKLVPWAHRLLLAGAPVAAEGCALVPGDVGCHLAPTHMASGVRTSLLFPILAGSSLVMPPELDVDALFDALDRYGVTWFTAGATMQREIVRRAPQFLEVIARSRLRFIRCGLSRIDPEDVDHIERIFGVPLLVGYSTSEASVVTQDPLPPRPRKRGSVGLPLLNEVAVMNEAGAFCATGGVGEILVRGPLVFDGYLDDAQATAAAFVDGWYRTGDLGRFDEDGYLYLAGRTKDLINRGGEKIAPAEIDAVIEAIPGVHAAATFGVPHPTLGEEIAAAVVADRTVVVEASGMIDQIRQRMGGKRVPRQIYFVDQLPRNDNGKVLRSALPRVLGLDQPDVAARAGSVLETAAPAFSSVEAVLVGLWSTVLHVKSVGARDDFFLLGGDSLQGARLLADVKVVFGVEIPLQALTDRAATVAGMARLVEEARAAVPAPHRPGDVSGPKGVAIPRRRDGGAAVLSDTQKRMWFLARLDPDSPAYNQSSAFRLSGEVNVTALRHALDLVTRRHEILRTTFTFVDDEPRQMPREHAAIEMRTVDLTATPLAQQENALRQVLLAAARKIFDLESGPLLRCVLVRLGEREHVFLRVWHHIISDGWSNGIFDRELSIAYRAFVAGHEPDLPDLPIQYADYAAWQREWLHGELIERQLGYWKEKLAAMGTLALPTDRPRPPVASHNGAHLEFDLPAPLAQGLRALGSRQGATLFMTLLSAFQVLLHRYSGQDDIAVGTPIAGRRHSALEGLIGFFANTLVLRSDLSGNPRFRELLARVRDDALDAYTHQDLPFEKLVEELAPARDMSRNPLFQVVFMLQNIPGTALALEGMEVSRSSLESHTAKFDLTLSMREVARGLRARWEYATDLFDASTIERMARHFERLLEGIVADPEQRIAELPLLTATERRQLLVEWNDTAVDYPADRCMHELFEAQAALAPAAVAVVFEDRRLTYGELNARANRLAHHLIALGVGPEVLVGVCMERSLESIVGLLGILKAGGAYVPLDPGYPAKRLEFMLEDTGARVLLTQRTRLDRLPQFEGRILCLDQDATDIRARSEGNPQTSVTPESPAYLMYTSGSTGEPKGVLVSHRGVVRLVKNTDYVSLNADETLLHMAPLSFDASTFELWGALLNGGRVVLMPPGQPGLAEIGAAIRRHRVTTLWLPAGLFHLMVDERLDDLKPLRQLLAGGDVLSAEHLVKARRALPGCRLVNGYGPTENTTFTCCYTVTGERELFPTVPIGRPIANTRVYVLDPHLRPVPVGVTGLLYAGGDGVARGYWRQPELTAERFLPDPFSIAAGARMYCTGDLARYRPDGNIQFLGRADDQIKLRGFRIELGEIEAVLSRHPAVRQAVAAIREDVPGGKQLVVYVVPADAACSDTGPLRELLRERLPEYMRPSAYVVMDTLPLTSNGKVDRKALPAPPAALAGAQAPHAAPRDSVEQTLCTIWAETLRIESVGLDDNFFNLGGHSLLAAKLFSRLNAALGRTLPLATLFAAPTVRGLAKFYRDAAPPPATALVAISPSGALPPVFALPGVSGNVLGYAALGQALAPEQPFYGLQSVGLDGTSEPFESIEQIAAHNIREMRRVQSRGPYYLVGSCFGATVAYEMVRQLLEADEQVAFLGLLHPSSLGGDVVSRPAVQIPASFRRGIALGRFVADRMHLYRKEMRDLGLTERMQFVRDKARLVGQAIRQRDLFRGDRSEFHQRRVYDANLAALLRYQHKPLPAGNLTIEIFNTERLLNKAPTNGVDWAWLTGGSATYHKVPGTDSSDMLAGDNGRTFAALLSVQLARARRG